MATTQYLVVRFGSGSVSHYEVWPGVTAETHLAQLQRQAAEATELDLHMIGCTRHDIEPVEWWIADGFEPARSFLRRHTMPGHEAQTAGLIRRLETSGR